MRFWLILFLCIGFTQVNAQCRTFRLNDKRDTLNCTDYNDKKQGKWVVHIDEIRGEPGYEEEGEFKDDKKEGLWRRYNLMGDFIAVESFKWGYKNGVSQYFNINGLEHEESWRAINPIYPYDTVFVPSVIDPDKYEMKVVKVDATAVKEGNWRYYDPVSGTLLRTETYFLDKLQDRKVDASADGKKNNAPQASKPKEVLKFERQISRKRKFTIRDGAVKY